MFINTDLVSLNMWDLKPVVNRITHVLYLYKITVLGSGVSKVLIKLTSLKIGR